MSKYQRRSEKIFELYKKGFTQESIGKMYKITRERVRQIITKEAFLHLAKEKGLNLYDPGVKELLRPRVERLVKKYTSSSRKKRQISAKLKILKEIERKLQGSQPENYFSISKFAETVGINALLLRKYCPELLEKIKNNKRKKWSWYYAQCRGCGTTFVKHRSLGYCVNCYPKSAEFKGMQVSSRIRNWEKRKKQVDNYQKDYSKRDYVIERRKQASDLKFFGGNREKAILRDNERCTRCGMVRATSKTKFGRDLFVRHKNGNKSNNELENLQTLCPDCFERTNFHYWKRLNR